MTPSANRVRRLRGRRAFALFARGLSLLLTLASAAAAPVKFNIPVQPAPDALRVFIKQSGTQVLFNAGDLKGAKVNEVVGNIEPAAALEQLLAGTGFSAQRSGSVGFVVTRTEKPSSGPNAANEEPSASSRRAQSKTESDIARLQPLVVTARKRVERLQDVPASIAAATGHTLSDLNLTSVTELDTIAPGLTFVTNPSRFGSGPSISLRGISTQTQSSGIQDSVGIVIDGVVVERAKAASFPDMSDTARVEILRGAQGTLFGKNASAGVISITTMDPSEVFDSRVTLGYATHDEKTMRAFVSGPIIDGLLLGRLSVYSKSRNGFVKNIYDGSEWERDDQEGFRGKLLFTPTTADTLKLSADYIEQENDGGTNIPRGFTSLTPQYVRDALGGIVGPENDRINTRPLGHNRQQAGGVSLQWDRTLDQHTLTALGAYRAYNQNFHAGTYIWLTPLNDGDQFGHTDQDQYTAEIRITSPTHGRLNYVAGLFLLDNSVETSIFDPATLNVVTSARSSRNSISYVETLNYAAFSDANLSLTDRLTLTGGLRWTHEEVDVKIVGHPIAPGLVRFGHPLGTTRDSVTANNVSWKLGSQWHLDRDRMFYVLATTGFKGPGFNVNTNVLGDPQPVRPEKATSFEAGMKSQLLGQRLTWNLSGYVSRFKDFQAQGGFSLPGSPTTTIILLNADELRTRGFETELAAKVSNATVVGLNATYIDAVFERFTNAPRYPGQPPATSGPANVQDLSGAPLPNTPKWAFNIYGRHEFDLPVPSWRGFATMDYSWRDKVQWNGLGSPNGIEPGYGLLGASLGLRTRNGRFSAKIYGKNLTDKFHTSGIVVGDVITHFLPPHYRRIFGVEVSFGY